MMKHLEFFECPKPEEASNSTVFLRATLFVLSSRCKYSQVCRVTSSKEKQAGFTHNRENNEEQYHTGICVMHAYKAEAWERCNGIGDYDRFGE